MSAPEAATEIVADVAEGVADQATHIAEVSRGVSSRVLSAGFGGLIVGLGLGGVAGYIYAQRQLEAKFSQIAADEVAEAREHYYAKAIALENSVDKPALEQLVRDQGYSVEEPSTEPPMAVSAPEAVVEKAKDVPEPTQEVKPPVPIHRNVFREFAWDEAAERAKRSPLHPYVIHRDEQEESGYDSVTYTYYEEDDVLCNERDEALSAEERERIIGEENLGRFGHGSDDPSIVYVRNDSLEMDIEVVLSPNSYAQEVHGLEPEIRHADRRRGRLAFDDD